MKKKAIAKSKDLIPRDVPDELSAPDDSCENGPFEEFGFDSSCSDSDDSAEEQDNLPELMFMYANVKFMRVAQKNISVPSKAYDALSKCRTIILETDDCLKYASQSKKAKKGRFKGSSWQQ